MTRMTRPDCAVMCNLKNTHTHQFNKYTHTHTHTFLFNVHLRAKVSPILFEYPKKLLFKVVGKSFKTSPEMMFAFRFIL